MDKELNQLYALFATRVGNVPAALVKGLYAAWQEDPERGLPTRAVESGVVKPEQSAMLVALVKQAVQSQGGNAAAALRQLGGEGAVRGALAGDGGGSARDYLGAWALPATIASASVAFLAIVIMGSGWYSAASARTAMQREMIRLEDSHALLMNEVGHLKQVIEITEERRQQAAQALVMAEDDLANERRRRREAEARDAAPLPDLPDLPGEGEAVPQFQWQEASPQQPPPRPVPLNTRQLERQVGNLNAETVLRQLQPTIAHNARGQAIGITSQNFSSMPIARQLGLQNGDVISNINGVNISGLGSYPAIEQAVRGGGPISVTILRNGQPLTATFNLR